MSDTRLETLTTYYNNYFKDLQQIDFIDHVPDILMENNQLIIIQERTIGISFAAIHLLYPICTEFLRDPEHEDMASWVILFLNGEHNTAWNIRHKLKLQKDLKLTQLVCIKFPGSSIAYNHRLTLTSTVQNELEFFKMAYLKKTRSYNLWIYRLKYLNKVAPIRQQIFSDEIELMKDLASKDVHNYSLFNHMYVCSRKCAVDLFEWAIELKETYKRLYIDQQATEDVDMKGLLKDETKIFFGKLGEYIGANIKFLIDREDEPHVFRMIKNRVYYISESIAKWATNVGKEELLHVGTCFGKFTKTRKFRLHITCLEFLAKYAKHKVWLKSNGEQSFLYGNHIIKAHLAKMSENIPQYGNVVLFNLQENALGFGAASRSTLQCKDIDPTTVVVFNQSDLGEYLRVEDDKH